jgi:hypothetical protein
VLEPTEGLESSGEVRDVNILRQLQLMDAGAGVSTSAWRDAVIEREVAGKTTFFERLKAITERGLVVTGGTPNRPVYSLTAAGRTVLASAIDG